MTNAIEVLKAAREHTPGPWSLPHFAKPDVNCNCEYVLCDEHMGAIASVHCSGEGDDWEKNGDNPRFEQAIANAHLIAAAPDMLIALKEMLDPSVDMEMAKTLAEQAIIQATGAA